MGRDTKWTNSDGLDVGFGTHDADNDVMSATGGTIKIFTISLPDATALEDTDAVTVASLKQQGAVIPRGSKILSGSFLVTKVFTTGSASTLDIGTYEAAGDGSSTGDDVAAGIDADIATTALDAVGDLVNCDGSLIGGAIAVGATADADCTVVFGFEESAFTAGAGVLTLEVLVPHGPAGRSVLA